MDTELVCERLKSAQKRLDQLCALNHGNLPGAIPHERQQLVQEFFFHVIGAIDVLAQCVNDAQGLAIDSEEVSVTSVVKRLPAGCALSMALAPLYVRTRGAQVPSNPYTDQALLFRTYNYRHQVTHRGANPFLFRIGALPASSFRIDPRDDTRGYSAQSATEEMQRMKDLVQANCNSALCQL